MDHRRFDDLTRALAGRRSRRGIVKGMLGVAGGTAALALGRSETKAAWGTQVCLPVDDQGNYTLRLVPKAAVPLYVSRYGAVLPENGVCPTPPVCPEACVPQVICVDLAEGGSACAMSVTAICEDICQRDADCPADRPFCLTALYYDGRRSDGCTSGFCGSYVPAG